MQIGTLHPTKTNALILILICSIFWVFVMFKKFLVLLLLLVLFPAAAFASPRRVDRSDGGVEVERRHPRGYFGPRGYFRDRDRDESVDESDDRDESSEGELHDRDRVDDDRDPVDDDDTDRGGDVDDDDRGDSKPEGGGTKPRTRLYYSPGNRR